MATKRSSSPSREARHARSRALRLVPVNGAVDDLVAAVGRERRRPMTLLAADVQPEAPTGMWVATNNADYIVYPADASSAERAAVICHELAHMLLGHQPEARMDQMSQMASLVAPSIDPDVARRFLQRHGYTEETEADAERLATALVTRLGRNAEAVAVREDAVSERLR